MHGHILVLLGQVESALDATSALNLQP